MDEKRVPRSVQNGTFLGVLPDVGSAGISGKPARGRSNWTELITIMQSIKNKFSIELNGNTYQPIVIYFEYRLPWDYTKRYFGLFKIYRKNAQEIGPPEYFVGCHKEHYDHEPEKNFSVPWRFAPISRQKFDGFVEMAARCPITIIPQSTLSFDGGEYEFHLFMGQQNLSIAWSARPNIGWHSINIVIGELIAFSNEAFPDF